MAPEVALDDDFRALGLEPGAEVSEVKQAYRRLAKKWHPDRHHLESYETRALAEKRFMEIDGAYRRIERSWEKDSQSRHQHADFNGTRPAAAKPRADFRSKRRPRFRARFQPTRLPLSAAVFILLLFVTLVSDIGPDRPVRVRKLVKRRPSTATAHRAAQPQTTIPHRTSPPALPKAGPVVNSFTLGSSFYEVFDIQGKPTRIQGDTWVYGLSMVYFKNGRVRGYNNFDGSLRVKMQPPVQADRSLDHITIGSTRQQVLQVQGTPSRIEGNRWYYGYAEVIFEDGLVKGYDNYFGTLKIRLLPSAKAAPGKQAGFFTQGSTPGEVLAVQGTPTAVHGNRWAYNFDYVLFRDGKVMGVINSDGALRFANPKSSGAAKGP